MFLSNNFVRGAVSGLALLFAARDRREISLRDGTGRR